MGKASSEYDYLSFDEFEELLPDKPRNERWELIGGRLVRMMVGARWEHARIVQNIAFGLEGHFRSRGSSCQTFTETFYMKSRPLEASMLPDVMVVCGDLEPGAISTEDPVLLFEVLSAGTEARDRFEKWGIYQRLASLRHYVLVARDRPHLEVFDRVEDALERLSGARWSQYDAGAGRHRRVAAARRHLPPGHFVLTAGAAGSCPPPRAPQSFSGSICCSEPIWLWA